MATKGVIRTLGINFFDKQLKDLRKQVHFDEIYVRPKILKFDLKRKILTKLVFMVKTGFF